MINSQSTNAGTKVAPKQFQPKAPIRVEPAIEAVVSTMQASPDILRGVKQCQHFIACFTGTALLPTVCARLIAIADNLTPPRPALVDAAKRASNMPSSSDRVATVDELRDHSPDFVVLETLHAVFAHLLQRWYQVRGWVRGWVRRGGVDEKYLVDENVCQIIRLVCLCT